MISNPQPTSRLVPIHTHARPYPLYPLLLAGCYLSLSLPLPLHLPLPLPLALPLCYTTMGAVEVIHLLLLTFTFCLTILMNANAHNITDILSHFPDYTLFNSYLTQTKLDGEINSRDTLTVLVLPNPAMSALAAGHPLSVIKRELSLHVLLDYFDAKKLHQISDGSTLSTTLYQTTGNAPGRIGSVNITDLRGGRVGFGSAAGSTLDAMYTKEVKQVPYNVSVLEISQPIVAPGLLTAPAPSASDMNLTAVLEKAGCNKFASLLLSTGVLKVYQAAAGKGLTVFAPSDEAFKAPHMPDMSKLTNAELVSLLNYHALASYSPFGALKTTTAPMTTLATNGAGKYGLTVSTAGDQVTLHTGLDSSRVATTAVDAPPLCIFTVDSVLLPPELFAASPAPAPGPGTAAAPAPAGSAPSPAPATAKAPSPFLSPPAPPAEAPGEAEKSTADKSDGGGVDAPAFLRVMVTASACAVISIFVLLS